MNTDIILQESSRPYGIALYQSILPQQVCQKVIEYFEATPKTTDILTKTNGKARTFEEIIMSEDVWYQHKILQKVHTNLIHSLHAYLDTYIAQDDLRQKIKSGIYNIQPRMKKYNPGDEFPLHSDDSSLLAMTRKFAYILYLNDNFTGGSTIFRNGKTEIARITPQEGTLAIFPTHSIYMHEGEKVETGSKYILNGFVEVLVSQARIESTDGSSPHFSKQEIVAKEIALLFAHLAKANAKIFGNKP